MKRTLAALAAVVVLAACGQDYNDKRGRGDAPVANWNDDPAVIVNMPDQFMNFAFKCLGPNGLYAHTRPAAPVVIVNDPNCEEGSPFNG